METLASVWARDPCDLSDLREPSCVWEAQCVLNSSPPAGQMWAEQLSPHLQRNKQLQDTLLQREEEVARLQEENNKLREFLNSSFVRNLEQKAKNLTADGRRKLKRNLMHVDEGPFQTCSHHLVTSQQVSKRVCRNLTAEFCSESSEMPTSSEPTLDLWVLRTLGLKDRDTIDTSISSSTSSPGRSLGSLVYDAAVPSSSSSSSSPGCTSNSSFSSPLATSTPPSVHSCFQRSTHPADYSYTAAQSQEANCGEPVTSPQNGSTTASQHSDLTASGPIRRYEAPDAAIRSYNTSTAFQCLTEEPAYSQSPDRAEICPPTATSRVQTLEESPAKHPAYCSAASQDTIRFSPPGERTPFPPVALSGPIKNQVWSPVCGGLTSLSAGSQPPMMPQTPRSRTDLAFSMSLSPSSSVKTHSFPQGQAFIRKDHEGRWNFTWVPRQGP